MMRLGKWRLVLWWVPALVLVVAAICAPWEPLLSYDNHGFGWPEILAALALLYMIGVAVARGFVARQPPPEPPRGFEVVMKPPPSSDEGPGKIVP
jgi:hypothetical protein